MQGIEKCMKFYLTLSVKLDFRAFSVQITNFIKLQITKTKKLKSMSNKSNPLSIDTVISGLLTRLVA